MSNFSEFVAISVASAMETDGIDGTQIEEATVAVDQALSEKPNIKSLALYSVPDLRGKRHICASEGEIKSGRLLYGIDVTAFWRAARKAEREYLAIAPWLPPGTDV